MNDLALAVGSISSGDYSQLTQLQGLLQNPGRYLSFADALLSSEQSEDILIFHGLNLLITAGTVTPSLYGTLKDRVSCLMGMRKTISSKGIAIGTLSKLIALVVSMCFMPNEITHFCMYLSTEQFVEDLFLIHVLDDLLMQIAMRQSTRCEGMIVSSLFNVLSQLVASLNQLLDSYISSAASLSPVSHNLQALLTADFKVLVTAVKWESLAKKSHAAQANSDDAFFLTKAEPFPDLISLLDVEFHTRIARAVLLSFLEKNGIVYEAIRELLLVLATVTYTKSKKTNIAFILSIILLLHFYQFRVSGDNATEYLADLRRAAQVLDLKKCIFQTVAPNILITASDFFTSGEWLGFSPVSIDELFPIQIMQSLVLGNGPTTMLSIFNFNSVTKPFCSFAFVLFFIYLIVSQDFEFAMSYLDSLMSIIHTSYQACVVGQSLTLVSPADAKNASLFSALSAFLVSIYTNNFESLLTTQIASYMIKCFDYIIRSKLTYHNLRRHSVQHCSNDCAQAFRDFSINLNTAIRYCHLLETMDVEGFNFLNFFKGSNITERILNSDKLLLSEPENFGRNLTSIIFNAILLFGLRDELLSLDEPKISDEISNTPYMCLSLTKHIMNQLSQFVKSALSIVASGFSGNYGWNTVIEACFYAQTALRWMRYTLYDNDDSLDYSDCLDQASLTLLTDAVSIILQNMGSMQGLFNHVNPNEFFINNTIIYTNLLCFDVIFVARKKLALPIDLIMKTLEKFSLCCKEMPTISTSNFVGFLLEYRANILTMCRLLVGSIRASEVFEYITCLDSLVSIELNDQSFADNPARLMEISMLLLTVSSGGLSALEKMPSGKYSLMKNEFMEKVFAAFSVLFPRIESLPNGSNSIISSMFLVRDIFFFAEDTIGKWVECLGLIVVPFFRQLIDSAIELMYRSLHLVMKDMSLPEERFSSLRHVYSGADVVTIAFSSQEELYLIFLAASSISINAMNNITNKMPALFLFSSDEFRELLFHIYARILNTILDFTGIISHMEDDDISKIVDMVVMILGQTYAVPDEAETLRKLKALYALHDSLSSNHILHKTKLFGCIATFSNGSLLLHINSDQVDRINLAYVQAIGKSASDLIHCVLTQNLDSEVISDLTAALMPMVLVDMTDTPTYILQSRLDVLHDHIVAAIQPLGSQDLISRVNSAFLAIHQMVLNDPVHCMVSIPIRELLSELQISCSNIVLTARPASM